MDADTRMACSLVLSLLVSAGNLRLAASGGADILDVGLRYVVAFLLAFVAVGVVGRVFRAYLDASEARRQADEADTPVDQTGGALRLADE